MSAVASVAAIRPPVLYFGAKANLASTIVEFMGAHKTYIEPFAGSLAVLLAKPPVAVEIANDLDGRLMMFWRVLRDRGSELIELADLTPHSRAELQNAAKLDADDELALAWQVWVLLTQGRTRTVKPTDTPGWRYYSGAQGETFQNSLSAYRSRLEPAMSRLRNVSLENMPATELIKAHSKNEHALFYVDPPYVQSTRQGAKYPHDLTDTDHRELAAVLRECAGTVLLSGYDSELYAELFPDWYTAVLASTKETLWSNRPLGNFLFQLNGAQ